MDPMGYDWAHPRYWTPGVADFADGFSTILPYHESSTWGIYQGTHQESWANQRNGQAFDSWILHWDLDHEIWGRWIRFRPLEQSYFQVIQYTSDFWNPIRSLRGQLVEVG